MGEHGRAGRSLRRWGAMVVLALAAVVMSAPVAEAAPRAAVRITARPTATSIRLGETATITGSVTPASATRRVVVQRGAGGVWSDRQGGLVKADGTFRINLVPSAAGVYAFRVRSSGGSVVSPTFYLKVRPPDLSRFVGDWYVHLNSLTIRADGGARLDYVDPSLCGGCPFSQAPATWVRFTLTRRSGQTATGRVTSSNRPGTFRVGTAVTATVRADSILGQDGDILELRIGSAYGRELCDQDLATVGACGG